MWSRTCAHARTEATRTRIRTRAREYVLVLDRARDARMAEDIDHGG